MSVVFEFLAYIFLEIIFGEIILGLFKFIGKGLDYLKRKILGLPPKPLDPIKKLEKAYLNKKIVLTETINLKIEKGKKGAILEIIDENSVFAEFYDKNDDQIEYNEDIVFTLKFNQFKLIDSKIK